MPLRIFILFILFINSGLFAQDPVRSFPQPLRKELGKLFGEEAVLTHLAIDADPGETGISGKYYTHTDGSGAFTRKYVYTGKVNTCRAGGCCATQHSTADQESEYFEYFILFDASAAILMVKIYNYAATHGQEISSKNWLNQFVNYDGSTKLSVGKNIDAISGATISVESITSHIERRTRKLEKALSIRQTSNAK